MSATFHKKIRQISSLINVKDVDAKLIK